MINLLPPHAKHELAAGRANRLLLRYLVLFLGLALIMLAAIGFVYLYMQNTQSVEREKIAANDQNVMQLAETQQRVASFKSDLATAKEILDKKVDYSHMILRIGQTIPAGVVVEQIELDAKTLGQSTKINARAKNEATVLRLKEALNASRYFEDAYFDVIERQEGDYQFAIIMSVTFTRELLND